MSHFKGGGGRSTVERNDAKTRWELLLSLFWSCQVYSELESAENISMKTFCFCLGAGPQKFKNKHKSSFSKLFRRRSKKASMGEWTSDLLECSDPDLVQWSKSRFHLRRFGTKNHSSIRRLSEVVWVLGAKCFFNSLTLFFFLFLNYYSDHVLIVFTYLI